MGNTPRRVRVSSEARVLHLEKKGYKPVDYDLGAGSDEVRIVLESLPQPPHVTHPGESPPSPVAAATEAEPEPPPMEEPGGFLVVLGRSFRDVGERIAGIGEALRGWLAPKDTP
jgi:hypothetical protein